MDLPATFTRWTRKSAATTKCRLRISAPAKAILLTGPTSSRFRTNALVTPTNFDDPNVSGEIQASIAEVWLARVAGIAHSLGLNSLKMRFPARSSGLAVQASQLAFTPETL